VRGVARRSSTREQKWSGATENRPKRQALLTAAQQRKPEVTTPAGRAFAGFLYAVIRERITAGMTDTRKRVPRDFSLLIGAYKRHVQFPAVCRGVKTS
jgi:hypothetical protein